MLKTDPDWSLLPRDTPASVGRLLRRCLDRDVAQRLRDIGEARFELAHAREAPSLGTPGPEPIARRVAPLVIASTVVAIIATFGLTRWLVPGAAITSNATAHVSIALPDGDEMGPLNESPLAVSDDGTPIIYRATRKGLRNLYWRTADGSGDEEALTTKPDVVQSPSSVSPDGRWLVFTESGAEEIGGRGIWVMRLDGDRTPRRLFPQRAAEGNGQVSPDGRWIAFEAIVSSRTEIYVAPFPGPGPRYQVSTDGGGEPLWSRDGRELFFQQGVRLMRVSPPRAQHSPLAHRSLCTKDASSSRRTT